mmetsp:Transcript_21566/g.42129  ORF Transcript_21566/g.42129 Transcript_21566/m.42129 type:complete len:292 (-) Transcript_21566:453-1328(-)
MEAHTLSASNPSFVACDCRAATMALAYTARHNSDLSSVSNGAADLEATSMSACSCSRLTVASSTSFLATNRCSRSTHCLDNFASSTWQAVNLDCSLDRSAVSGPLSASEVFASWSRAARNFLASVTAACALCSVCAMSSHTVRASSAEISFNLSSPNLLIVSASFCTAVSTSLIFSPEACICVLRLRSAVSFFSSASFVAPTSSFFCNPFSSLQQSSAGASANCFASTSFCTTNVRASLTARCPLEAAVSQTVMAFDASDAASTSMPLRKGNSASAAFWISASAFSTFSIA